jgi:hypothetical protein
MTLSINDTQHRYTLYQVNVRSVSCFICSYAEWHYAEGRYAECRGANLNRQTFSDIRTKDVKRNKRIFKCVSFEDLLPFTICICTHLGIGLAPRHSAE